jgi:hypothetical protein
MSGGSESRAPEGPIVGHGPTAATGEDALLRLSLWLADVASEAALAAVPPQVVAPRPGPADEPPVVEPAP